MKRLSQLYEFTLRSTPDILLTGRRSAIWLSKMFNSEIEAAFHILRAVKILQRRRRVGAPLNKTSNCSLWFNCTMITRGWGIKPSKPPLDRPLVCTDLNRPSWKA